MRRPSTFPQVFAYSATVLSLAMMPLSDSLRAADSEWNGGGTGGSWTDLVHWSNGIPGALGVTTNADLATLRTGSGSIGVDATRNLRSFAFSSTAGAFILGNAGASGGPALHLSHGGTLSMAQGSSVTQRVHAPLILEANSATSNGTYTFANNTLAADPSGAATPITNASTPKLLIEGSVSGGTTTGSITLTLAGTVGTRNANNGNPANDQASQQANTISGVISDGGAQGGLSLQIQGITSGNSNRYNAWNLTGANTYSGATHVGQGTLYFNSLHNVGVASALGTGVNGDIFVAGSAFLIYTGGNTTSDRTIRGAGGAFHNHGTGGVTLNGSVITTGGLIFRGAHSFTVNGQITGSSTIGNNGGLRTTLNHNENTFSGDILIYDGNLAVGTVSDAGAVSAMGLGSNVILGQQSANAGNFEYIGAQDGYTNRTFKLNSGAAINGGNGKISVLGTGSLHLTGRIQTISGNFAHVAHIDLSGSGHGVVEGIIGGLASGPETETNTRLTKSGSGTWDLLQRSYIYGNVAVNAGTLLVNNQTYDSATGSGSVTVSGTGVLGGKGIVDPASGNAFTVANTGSLMVGNTHGVALGEAQGKYVSESSVLMVGLGNDTSINLNGKLLFDLFSNMSGFDFAENDLLIFNTLAPTIQVQGAVVHLANRSGETGWTSGSWQLVDWGSSSTEGTVSYNLDESALARGYAWDTSNFLNDGTVSIEKHAYFWNGAGADDAWASLDNWDSTGAPPAGSSSTSSEVRDVIFGAVASGGSSSGVFAGDRRVVNIYYTDAGTNHTHGVGPSGGGATLYTFGNTLEVAGGTQTLNATLRLRGLEEVFTIKNEGTLNLRSGFMWNRADGGNLTRTLVFSGSGATNVSTIQTRKGNEILHLRKTGSGVTTISGYSNLDPNLGDFPGAFLGKTSILEGKLRINHERALGRAYGQHTADHLTIDGGTLSAYGNFTFAEQNRGITIGGSNGTIEVEGTTVLTLNTQMVGSGNLTKTGSGTLEMTADQSNWTRTINVNQGVLRASNTVGSATGSGSVIVHAGGTLSGDGSLTGGSASSITLGAGSALVVGNHHAGTAVKSDLLLGSKANPNTVDLQLQTVLKFDVFGAGLMAEIGDLLYNDLANVQNDLLILSTLGNLNLSGATVELAAAHTGDFAIGQTWKLIDWSSSNLANLNTSGLSLLTTSIGGFALEQRIASDGFYIQIVPEPHRALLILGALGAFAVRRKRQK